MEAPEKLYILKRKDYREDRWLVAYQDRNKKFREEEIEYTRTDAFMKKAIEFINERLVFEDKQWRTDDNEPTIIDKVIEDFKNHMKE